MLNRLFKHELSQHLSLVISYIEMLTLPTLSAPAESHITLGTQDT